VLLPKRGPGLHGLHPKQTWVEACYPA